MWGSCACQLLPEHPREQDCVTRPLPSLFRLRPLPTPVASCQLPERPLTGQAVCARAERAKSEERKANSDESKSLFWNILPITPTGSIFCGESFLIAFYFQYFARDIGGGGRHQLPVSRGSATVTPALQPSHRYNESCMTSLLYAAVAYVRSPVGIFVEQLRRELHP